MHPIQYHVPIYRELEKLEEVETTVLYADTLGLNEIYNPEFKTTIKWNIPLLDGYDSLFFKNYAKKRITGFFSRINPGIFWHLLSNKYDVVLIHGYQTFSAWLVFIAAKLRGTKIVFRGEAIPKKQTSTWKKQLSQWVTEKFLASCDAVMYSCTGNKLYWQERKVPNNKMFFIPCAVDNEYFSEQQKNYLPDRNQLRQQEGILENDFVILFLSRFTARKRALDLIKAVSIIEHKNIVLLFVGDGLERDIMEAETKASQLKAVFTGFKNQDELSKYYTMSDMFAVISSYDASPKALNEALNFKLPVLVTDQVGTAYDLVCEDENGFIVLVGDVETMAMHITKLNQNRKLATQMGEKSIEIVTDWSLQNDAKGVLQALKYVVGRHA